MTDQERRLQESPWEVHFHAADDGGQGYGHIHAPGSAFSVALEIPIRMQFDIAGDVKEFMFFRGLVSNLLNAIDIQRAETNLDALPVWAQSFAIITAFADEHLMQGLLQVIDNALHEKGVVPPTSLIPLESSNIEGAGFAIEEGPEGEIADEGVLFLAFRDGGVYRYEGVPMAVANDFWGAESQGKFFHAEIKGRYDFSQVK